MGKSSKWFRCFLGLKKHDPSSPSNQNPKPTKKKKWSFVKFCREKDSNFVKEPSNYGRVVSNSRAIAVVEATAVVKRSGVSASSRENWAAVVIQSHFRAYLSRRALRGLKGLVKLQALVRGHIVRQQTVVYLRQMQAISRTQSRARVERSRSPHSRTKSVQFLHVDSTTPEKFEHVIRARSLKNDETSMLKSRGDLRGLKGLVKLQAPVRGHIVRQKSAVFLWQLKAAARAKSRARAVRSQVTGSPHSATKSVQFLHADPTTLEKFEHVIRTRSLKHDETSMLQSRRALQGLKGQVKLQAPMRGHIVRQESAIFLRQLQAVARAKSRSHAGRSQITGSPHSSTQSAQFLHVDTTTPEKFEHVIRAWSLKHEETSILKSRRGLRALKGLVKFQALVRGHIVRQQTTVFPRQMQAIARAQSRTHAGWSQVSGCPHSNTKSVQFLHAHPTTPEKFEHVICTRSLKHDETSMLQSRRALQGLNGLVKLQAPVRGHIVRQQTAVYLRQMQAIARAQSRTHAGRSRISGSTLSSAKQVQFLYADPPTLEKFEHVIRVRSLKHDETSMIKSRRALRGLNGLVKLQALVRGQIVRQQTTVYLRQMQAIARAQSRARAGRSQVSGSPHSSTKSVQFLHADHSTPEKFEHVIHARSLKHDETSMLQSRRALQGLKGLVKLQALVRGHIVRQESAVFLRQLQAVERVQSRARARKYQVIGPPHSNTKSVQFLHVDPTTLEKFENVIRIKSLKQDETSMLKSRRALRGLNGLVKLQALVRGQIVRRQTAVYLRQMQAIARAQLRARAGRSQVSGSPYLSTKSVQFLHADPTTSEKFEHIIRARSLKHDETFMLQSRRALRALKGLVKLQALVRGHIVRQESIVFLRQLKAVARVQSRACVGRSLVLGSPHSSTKPVQFFRADPTTPQKFEHVICARILKNDETSMLQSRGALRGLMGPVKLQVPVRGHIVRQESAVFLWQLQAVARAMSRAHAGWSQVIGYPHSSTQSVQLLHVDLTTPEKFEHVIRARSLKYDKTFMLKTKNELGP